MKLFQTIEETCKSTGLSTWFLRNGCRSGSIPCIKVGRKYFINVPSLLEMLGVKMNEE